MLEYRLKRDRRGVPMFVFEDKAYALLGEFLLAEGRNFGKEILSFLEKHKEQKEPAEFAGNVFRIEVLENEAKVVNDLTDKECRVPLADLANVVKDYEELA